MSCIAAATNAAFVFLLLQLFNMQLANIRLAHTPLLANAFALWFELYGDE